MARSTGSAVPGLTHRACSRLCLMPTAEGGATDRHDLVRNIQVVRGTMRFAIEIQPRFDYGRAAHKLEATEDGGVFQADGMSLMAHAIAPHDLTVQDAGIEFE